MEFNTQEKKVSVNHGNFAFRRSEAKQVEENNNSKELASEKGNLTLRILDSLMSISFFALFFGLPLFFLNSTFQGISFEKQIYFYFWVLVAIISWATKSIIVGELKIKETPLDYFIWAFAGAYLLATIFSIDRWHSFFGAFGDQSRGFINVLACILVYYFILSNFSKKRLVISLVGIIASGIIVQLWTLIGLFLGAKLPTALASRVPISLFGSMTSLGAYLTIIYPLFVVAIYKLVESPLAKAVKIALTGVTGFFFLVNIVLMWFLYSFIFLPNVFPGLIVGVSFFVIFIIALIVKPAQGWSWLTFFAFMAVLVLLMIGGGDSYLPQRLPAEISPSYGLSLDVIKGAMKDKFFLGSGSASYGFDFSKYRSQNLNDTQFFNLRFYQGAGMFFESLPTIGFLGTVTLFLVVLVYLGSFIFLLSREKEKNKLYSLGLFSAALIFLYGAIVSRVDGSLLLFGVLIIILSLGALQLESESEKGYHTLSLKASPKYALALAFIFMLASGGVVYVFVFMGKSLVADIYMRSGAVAETHAEDTSVTKMVKAINLYPNEARYYNRIGQEYVLLANNEALKGKDKQDVTVIQQYLNNAIFLANKSKELAPNDVLAVEGLAQVYENSVMFVDKSADLAEQYYTRALELEPHNPVYYIKLGEMKIAKAGSSQDVAEKKKIVAEALDIFQKSVAEKKDYATGYYYIATANEALGDMDKAIDAIKNAVVSERNNVNYVFVLANFLRERGKGDDYAQAEQIYKGILAGDDKQYNVNIALGLLYEKQKKNESAIGEYRKVLANLPDGSDEAKTQINKLITNVQSGTGNLQNTQAQAQATPAVPQPTPTETQATVPQAPQTPVTPAPAKVKP